MNIYLSYLNYVENNNLVHSIVEYIAGFVVKSLKLKLSCSSCLAALVGDKLNYFPSLISQKDRGGLTYPSQDVIQICRTSENILRSIDLDKLLIKNNLKLLLTTKVLSLFVDKRCFTLLDRHNLEYSPLENHTTHLIKLVAAKYIDIRLHYHSKYFYSPHIRIRNFYNRLVIFKNQ